MHKIRRVRSFVAAGAGAAVVAAGVGLPAASAQGAVTAAPASTLRWSACPADQLPKGSVRLQCASVQVPLDHAHPRGASLSLALYRTALPAGVHRPAKVLFVNAGGPGAEASEFTSVASATYPAAVRARYDIVGVDPRGVGRSAPVTCVDPTQVTPVEPTPDLVVRHQLQRRETALSARAYVDSCVRASGALLPYLSTDQTARDFDVVRARLGVPTAAFVGYSYGTLLFSRYASLFPTRVERLVLDSAVDPRTWGLDFFVQRALPFEARLGDFAAWAASHDAQLELGATPSAVLATYDAIIADLRAEPLVAEDAAIGAGDVQTLMTSAMYSSSSWDIAAGLLSLVREVQTGGVPAASGAAAAISSAARMQAALPAALPTPGPDNQAAALYGVLCNEGRFPRGTRPVFTRINQLRAKAPRLGAIQPLFALPCTLWPSQATTASGPTLGIRDVPGAAPLVVQAVKDPVTPYTQGLAMTRLVDAGLLTVTGGDHTHFGLGTEPCTDAVVGRYLLTGVPPARGAVCAGAPLPDPSGAMLPGTGSGAGTGGTAPGAQRATTAGQRSLDAAREVLRRSL